MGLQNLIQKKAQTFLFGLAKWYLQEVLGFISFYVFLCNKLKINSIMTKSL